MFLLTPPFVCATIVVGFLYIRRNENIFNKFLINFRFADDAFATICSMVNDLSILRTQAKWL